MPNLEDVLREQTYKEEYMDVEVRVLYTLRDGEKNNLQAHRNSKAIAMLIKTLRDKNILSDIDIDNILLECIN